MSDSATPQIPFPVADGLEQQMDELGLPGDLRHFLRHLHAAEIQLNAAFALAQKGGDMDRCVSHVYAELYGRQNSASRR